jgi:hypothetical protein
VRVGVTLACTDCKSRNYTTEKNKKNNPERFFYLDESIDQGKFKLCISYG